MGSFPTGYLRWLRLFRSGQEVRAQAVVRAEAERTVLRREAAADAALPARRPAGALRLSRILAEALRITRLYKIWETRLIEVEVICPPSRERDESRATRETGAVVDVRDDRP